MITIFFPYLRVDGTITQKIGVTHGYDANSVFCPTNGGPLSVYPSLATNPW
jgi:hypothetical protein